MFVLTTMARRGLLTPGNPVRITRQFAALGRWGFGLAGELRQAAARSPHRVAVVDEKGTVTYADLLARASRLTAALPFSPGDRVGLLRRNSASMIETLIAVTQLGADPVLINTGLSGPQLAGVIANQGLRALIHDDEFAEALPAVAEQGECVLLGETDIEKLVAGIAGARLRPPERPGRTIVLTSGTTGTSRDRKSVV